MKYILDLVIIAIIVITMFLSAKRGFVRVAVELVGFIVACFLTFTISTPLSDMTYDKIIEPTVIESVSNVTEATSEQLSNGIWENLPNIVKDNSEMFKISKESLDSNLSSNINNGTESAAKTASQNIIKPVATKILSLLYSVVLLIALMFIVKLLAKLLNKLFSFSVVGKLNRILGGIIGIPKGIIIVVVFCMVVSLIVSYTTDGFLIFNKESINNSVIYNFIYKLIPFN